MVRKYVGEVVYNSFVKPVVKAFTKPEKTTGTEVIKNIKVAPNLTTKRNIQDAVVKAVDEGTKKGLGGTKPSPSLKQSMSESKVKKSRELKDYSYTADKYEKRAKGGRVGLKRGTGLMKKKSDVQKIKETFGPRQSKAKKKKFPDLTGDGKVTFADILKGRGVINGKKKKKVI